MDAATTRVTCPRCRRAASHCWCEHVHPVELGFELALLMHPKEARVAIGTGRMAHLSVRGSRLLLGEHFDGDPRLDALLDREGLAPALLFPGPGALDLSHASPDEARAVFPAGRRPLVLVVDGTWSSAKKLATRSPRLMALPMVRFSPETLARYDRIRKEPRPECSSTLESVHALVDHLDRLGVAPAPAGRAHDGMLTLLERFITRQEAYVPEAHRRAIRGRRAGPGLAPDEIAR